MSSAIIVQAAGEQFVWPTDRIDFAKMEAAGKVTFSDAQRERVSRAAAEFIRATVMRDTCREVSGNRDRTAATLVTKKILAEANALHAQLGALVTKLYDLELMRGAHPHLVDTIERGLAQSPRELADAIRQQGTLDILGDLSAATGAALAVNPPGRGTEHLLDALLNAFGAAYAEAGGSFTANWRDDLGNHDSPCARAAYELLTMLQSKSVTPTFPAVAERIRKLGKRA